MATLIRSLTNSSSSLSLKVLIDGYDPTGSVTIAPSATLDLLSIVPVEALHSMQTQLASIVASGQVTVAATIDSSALYNAAILNWISSSDTQIVFNPTASSGTHTAGATTVVQVENAAGAIDVFDNSTTVVVSVASGGTSPLLNGHVSPITVTMNKGTATVVVTDSASGTPHLALSAPSRTLTVSSTYIATLS